jgi:heat shock protein HslJ
MNVKCITLAATVAMTCLWGCTSGKNEQSTKEPALVPLVGTPWKIVSVGGKPVRSDPDMPSREPGFLFDATTGRVAGSGGVNNMSGGYKLDGRKLTVGPMMQTQMAGDPELMAQEFAIGKAMAEVRSYEISGTTLTLLSESKVELLRLTATKATPK